MTLVVCFTVSPCFFHYLIFIPQQDDHENMQDMSIFDMSVVDEADNDNGIPAEVEEDKLQESTEEPCDEDELLQDTEEQDKEKLGLDDESPIDEVSPSLMDL